MTSRAAWDAAWVEAIEQQDLLQLAHLMKLDFVGVCRYMFTIRDKKNRKIPLVPNRSQMVLLRHISDDRSAGRPLRYWQLKGRQIGSSTIWAMYLAWRTFMHGENSLITSYREKPGKSLFDKVDLVFSGLPAGTTPKPSELKKGDILRFGDPLGSVIRRDSAELVDVGVGETFQHALFTEGPLYKDAEATTHAFFPTIADDNPNSSIIWEFTARGVGDYTHQMWMASVRGETGFTPIFLPWYWFDEYQRPLKSGEVLSRESREYAAWVASSGVAYPLDDEGEWLADRGGVGFELSDAQLAWREDQLRKYRGNVDKFRREFPAVASEGFQTSGRLVIPPSVVDRYAAGVRKSLAVGEFHSDAGRVSLLEREDGRLHVAERPVPGRVYVVSADSSSGMGADRSAVHVIEANDPKMLRVVAEFNGMETPSELAKLLARLANAYNGAVIAPERNFHGGHVIDVLRNNPAFEKRFTLYRHHDPTKRRFTLNEQFGFPTSRGTKGPLIDKMVELLYEGRVWCPFDRTVSEFRSFVYLDDGDEKVGASSGTHDDLVMSLAVGLWVADLVARQGSVEWDTEGEASVFDSALVVSEAIGF